MTDEKKKLEIKFMPGCFDHFDGTQEELDEMMAELTRLAESGEIFDKSTPVDIDSIIEDLSEEEMEEILNEIIEEESTTKRYLQ